MGMEREGREDFFARQKKSELAIRRKPAYSLSVSESVIFSTEITIIFLLEKLNDAIVFCHPGRLFSRSQVAERVHQRNHIGTETAVAIELKRQLSELLRLVKYSKAGRVYDTIHICEYSSRQSKNPKRRVFAVSMTCNLISPTSTILPALMARARGNHTKPDSRQGGRGIQPARLLVRAPGRRLAVLGTANERNAARQPEQTSTFGGRDADGQFVLLHSIERGASCDVRPNKKMGRKSVSKVSDRKTQTQTAL
ncbi:hypothetical protein B0H17DRAFT_1151370 [Mycena rosella]|uniref:Uncharacterized protein n=1 Tax=Mycena rosella TaxID=1033263 RepID=A0AAD7BKR8_MYCRO|nr:hypothetical protein B0H17DRAFT_1151370 [Mycena rosella]